MVPLAMSRDGNEWLCWMDRYHAALKRRRNATWRRRFNKTTLAVGMLLAGALLLAYLERS
jgi:hypothetical protein